MRLSIAFSLVLTLMLNGCRTTTTSMTKDASSSTLDGAGGNVVPDGSIALCGNRTGGALITETTADNRETYTSWVTNDKVIDTALAAVAGYFPSAGIIHGGTILSDNVSAGPVLALTSGPANPNSAVVAGRDCDPQWDFHTSPTNLNINLGDRHMLPEGCDDKPSEVQAHNDYLNSKCWFSYGVVSAVRDLRRPPRPAVAPTIPAKLCGDLISDTSFLIRSADETTLQALPGTYWPVKAASSDAATLLTSLVGKSVCINSVWNWSKGPVVIYTNNIAPKDTPTN